MPHLDQLPEISRNSLLTLPIPQHDTAPFTPLSRPLNESRLAVVTTAGLHLRDDPPFRGADPSYRVIPSASRADEIVQSHASIGFDRVPVIRDLNVTLPLDRLRELVSRRELGGLGPACYSFMGAQRDWSRIEQESAPAVATRLLAEGVDTVLLTPT
ncbi:MAG: glycine/sarcosine/betaine reductase selenoprotein B family protein [Dehalococcoidia bacterium]